VCVLLISLQECECPPFIATCILSLLSGGPQFTNNSNESQNYKKNKRARSGPMRDELWGLGPMAGGGVGGVMCLITRARGAKPAVPPLDREKYSGVPRLFR
jgi:hypothetical protein